MNFEQVEKVYSEIMENAVAWASGKECDPIYQNDLLVIGECLKINLHKCFHNFEYSNNVNHAKAYSSHKTIYKQLEKIKEKLLIYSNTQFNMQLEK